MPRGTCHHANTHTHTPPLAPPHIPTIPTPAQPHTHTHTHTHTHRQRHTPRRINHATIHHPTLHQRTIKNCCLRDLSPTDTHTPSSPTTHATTPPPTTHTRHVAASTTRRRDKQAIIYEQTPLTKMRQMLTKRTIRSMYKTETRTQSCAYAHEDADPYSIVHMPTGHHQTGTISVTHQVYQPSQ